MRTGQRLAAKVHLMKRPVICRHRPSRIALQSECLEERRFLDGAGVGFPEVPDLTVSFPADGTDINGLENSLHAKFEGLGAAWKETILEALQTWASETNANLAVQEDEGLPFGVPGLRRGDSRFGDIRIGARPLADNVMAISVAHDSLTAGTWSGDIIFNSQSHFQSLDDLYSVALHEAGHVFGLEHNDEPDSVMHIHGVSHNTQLTFADKGRLTDLFGIRQPDAAEAAEGFANNDTFRQASELETGEARPDSPGSAPAFLFGDITTRSDVDYYELDLIDEYTGPLTIELRTQGISLLRPVLTLYRDPESAPVQQSIYAPDQNGRMTIRLPQVQGEDAFWIRVEGATEDTFAIGSYVLLAKYDELNVVPDEVLDELAVSAYRRMAGDDFDDYFDEDAETWFNDDASSDDQFEDANELQPIQGMGHVLRYDFFGSLTSARDIDHYAIVQPETTNSDPIITVSVRSLDEGGLIPHVRILGPDRVELVSQTIVHGNGEVIVQAHGLAAGESYRVEITSDKQSAVASGNYSLQVALGGAWMESTLFAQGVLERSAGATDFYVATPQLFHFALQVDAQSTAPGAIVGRIFDDQGNVVHQVLANAGTTQTAGSVLLNPGEYRFTAFPLLLDAINSTPMHYALFGQSISDPFGVDPLQPSAAEFQCPGLAGVFCYPSGVISLQPFLWDIFLVDYPSYSTVNPQQLNTTVKDAWWNWYRSKSSDNHAPQAGTDHYRIHADVDNEFDPWQGVLANDFDPDRDRLQAILQSTTKHGELILNNNGSFTYIPEAGFTGIDQFTYLAADQWSASTIVQVELIVAHSSDPLGDFNQDGACDSVDLQLLKEALQQPFNGAFDINGDQQLDLADWQTMVNDKLATSYGDANLDRTFDSRDLILIFQAGEYEDSTLGNSRWEDGDWNADGEFTSADLIFAFQTGKYRSL